MPSMSASSATKDVNARAMARRSMRTASVRVRQGHVQERGRGIKIS
jgi:hypothetical protein